MWLPTADPMLVNDFIEVYGNMCGIGCDRNTFSKIMRSVKESIAFARYWDYYYDKLTGSLECDETHL